jgi:hypothetical protein
MTNQHKLDELRERQSLAMNATMIALGLATLAILGALAHFETGSGPSIRDAHVPADWLIGLDRALFAPGEPYDVGPGVAKLVQWVLVLSFAAAQLFGLGLLVWSLKKKRKQFITPAIVIFLMADILCPVPKVVVAGTGKAVSIETAEKLLAVKPMKGPIRLDKLNGRSPFQLAPQYAGPAMTYVRAQIAYARGDRAAARKLSANLSPQTLASPIEAPYRLQFLQGQYKGITTVCFTRLGCVNEEQRQWRFAMFVWVAVGLALGGIALWTLCFVLTRQLTRVEELAAEASQIHGSRYA